MYAVDTTYNHTFVTGEITKAAGSAALGDFTWSWTGATYYQFNEGVRIGMSDKPQTTPWVLSTEGIKGTIKSVKVTAYMTKKGAGKAKVTVGGQEYGTKTLTTSSATYEFTGTSSGKIEIALQASAKQIVFTSFSVTYEDGGSTSDPELADAGLSFPQAQYSANLGEGFEKPTLKKDTDAEAVYSSTVESVATVNPSTGVITLVAAGTTTIKANTVATKTHKAGEASYTLTVNDPNAIKAQVVMANQNLDKNKYGKDKTVNWVSEDKKYTFVTSATVGSGKTTYPQYNSDNNPKGLRIYSSNGNVMTVNAPAGYKFVSAKATGSAGLKYNGSSTVTSSGTEIALNNATSFTFESGIPSTMAITRFDFVLASDNPVVPAAYYIDMQAQGWKDPSQNNNVKSPYNKDNGFEANFTASDENHTVFHRQVHQGRNRQLPLLLRGDQGRRLNRRSARLPQQRQPYHRYGSRWLCLHPRQCIVHKG